LLKKGVSARASASVNVSCVSVGVLTAAAHCTVTPRVEGAADLGRSIGVRSVDVRS